MISLERRVIVTVKNTELFRLTPVFENFVKEIGTDAYAEDAVDAVRVVQRLL